MTEQELFQLILKEIKADKELENILEKIKSGTATFEDTQRYSYRSAEIRAGVLSRHVSKAGTGKNESACYRLLEEQHQDINQKMASVQKSLDEQQNLHINAKKAKFPEERARTVAHSLEDMTVSQEVIERRARNAVASVANSFHDDYMKANASFRSYAGLTCYVTRTGGSKCCAWCASLSGRYVTGTEPKEFWQRHDKCTCTIDYENNKFRQKLRGVERKRDNGEIYEAWEVIKETDHDEKQRRFQRIQYKPTAFTPEQARELEAQKLSQYRGLTIPGKTDIMKESNSRYKQVTDSAIENMPSIPLFQAKKTGLVFKDKLLANEAAEKNELYRQACQNLLQEASKHKDLELGTEFGIVYDKNMKPIKGFGYVIGKVGSVRFGTYPAEPFHVLHNHPSGETFSYADLLIFASQPNMMSLSAVGNQNNLYVVSATDKSDKRGYSDFLNEKTGKTLYTTVINGEKVEFSYNLVAVEGNKRRNNEENLISKLTEKQRKELEESLIKWSDECIEGCEKYGIRYQFRKT